MKKLVLSVLLAAAFAVVTACGASDSAPASSTAPAASVSAASTANLAAQSTGTHSGGGHSSADPTPEADLVITASPTPDPDKADLVITPSPTPVPGVHSRELAEAFWILYMENKDSVMSVFHLSEENMNLLQNLTVEDVEAGKVDEWFDVPGSVADQILYVIM